MPRLVALALLLCSCSFEPMTERPEPGDTQPDAPPQIACNHDLYETELAGHRYYLTDPMTWTAARDHCTATGGYLLTLETREEDQAAYDRLWQRNGYVWIGLQDVTTTDEYPRTATAT